MKRSDVKRVAVMGLGKMGVDWVANLLEGGYEVIGFDALPAARERAPGALAKGLGWIAKKRHPEESDFVDNATARFSVVDSEDAFAAELESCQVLLEVIFEDLDLKCEVLARVVPRLPEGGMVWTNTSSLSVHTMGVASGRPELFVGTHGMNPVYQMPAVEVVRHRDLAEATLALTVEILEGIGKSPFVASDVSGFWVNKHLVPFMLEAMRALERGGDHGRGRRRRPQGQSRPPAGRVQAVGFHRRRHHVPGVVGDVPADPGSPALSTRDPRPDVQERRARGQDGQGFLRVGRLQAGRGA